MLDYLVMALLVLNVIGAVLLFIKGANQKTTGSDQAILQKVNKQYQNLVHEITDIKASMDRQLQTMLTELEQLKEQQRAMEISAQAGNNSSQNENLFLYDRYKEIFTLQKQGLSVEEIAKKLEKGTGEVSFILQLANQDHE